jgi:predicted SAM-dependent methyltransferase
MKLDIGCGDFKKEGFLGVDPYMATADYQAPMWELPFPDSSIEEIYSSHALEHISKFEVVPTLTEWQRVIIPGCSIEIHVPDLRWCCQQWLQRQSTDWFMDILFGLQTHPGEFHKTGFTPEIMKRYLVEAGLKLIDHRVVDSHGQPTLVFVATK